MNASLRPLDRSECQVLAAALGDSPETVGSIHVLLRHLCKAYVSGATDAPAAAIVQSDFCANEPVGFGCDPDRLWDLLATVKGWDCFLVSSHCSQRIAELMRAHTGQRVGFIDDISFVLDQPVAAFTHPSVRLLTLDDPDLLSAAPPAVAGSGYRDTGEFLSQAIAAAAIVDGAIASLAFTAARSERYADIGVHTLAPFRRRGFARTAASLVAARVQEEGQLPVWSTGHFNTASLNLARDLGFVEVLRRTYVVSDRIQNWRFARQFPPADSDKPFD